MGSGQQGQGLGWPPKLLVRRKGLPGVAIVGRGGTGAGQFLKSIELMEKIESVWEGERRESERRARGKEG
eukprot:1320397-Amorphochlora_amoeboformis.AAC.1